MEDIRSNDTFTRVTARYISCFYKFVSLLHRYIFFPIYVFLTSYLSLCCAENYDNLGNLHRCFAFFLLLLLLTAGSFISYDKQHSRDFTKTPTLQSRGRGRVAVAVGPHQESE